MLRYRVVTGHWSVISSDQMDGFNSKILQGQLTLGQAYRIVKEQAQTTNSSKVKMLGQLPRARNAREVINKRKGVREACIC